MKRRQCFSATGMKILENVEIKYQRRSWYLVKKKVAILLKMVSVTYVFLKLCNKRKTEQNRRFLRNVIDQRFNTNINIKS